MVTILVVQAAVKHDATNSKAKALIAAGSKAPLARKALEVIA
jgi:hypothetical protein